MNMYKVVLTTTSESLGTAPTNPTVYQDYIASKRFANEKKVATTPEEKTAIADKETALIKEELAMLPDEADSKGLTCFRRDVDGNLCLTDFMVRGFLKEAGNAVGINDKSVWGLTSKIDKWVFVTDAAGHPIRTIPMLRNGAPITKPEDAQYPNGIFQRPLRAMTAQGPRVTLAASEIVEAGVTLEFYLRVFPLALAVKADGKTPKMDAAALAAWLAYGEFCGLGQWRNGGMGRFTAVVTEVKP